MITKEHKHDLYMPITIIKFGAYYIMPSSMLWLIVISYGRDPSIYVWPFVWYWNIECIIQPIVFKYNMKCEWDIDIYYCHLLATVHDLFYIWFILAPPTPILHAHSHSFFSKYYVNTLFHIYILLAMFNLLSSIPWFQGYGMRTYPFEHPWCIV